MKKCDHAISLSIFLKNQDACRVCKENKKRQPKQKNFDVKKEFIRLCQINGTKELTDVQDMDSTVNEGTNSRVTSDQD